MIGKVQLVSRNPEVLLSRKEATDKLYRLKIKMKEDYRRAFIANDAAAHQGTVDERAIATMAYINIVMRYLGYRPYRFEMKNGKAVWVDRPKRIR